MLSGAWLVGFFFVGQARAALADDGLIVGPDLGSAGGATVFERFGPDRFGLYLQLSDGNHGAPYISQSMWQMLRSIESALMYLMGALARGAITSMQWMLNLHIYADHSADIDQAVRSVAAQVFWPLFGATMAIGAFAAYGRMRREGGGSLFTDVSWLVAASVFAGAFALAPSAMMAKLDQARTAIGAAAMTGYSGYGSAGQSAAGFPAVSLPDDQAGATRTLSDAMWNVYVVSPWCYVNFNSVAQCADVGHDYITGDARWTALTDWMAGKNGGNSDETHPPYCPKEINADCDWIRGQSFGRLGATIFVVAVTIPLVVMLLILVLFGIMAIVGFALLILIGVFFVLGWMIPGRPRQMGVRWFEEVLGSLLQSIIITAVLGSVMVLDAILNAGISRYGFFMVGMLNLATFVVGFRMRGRLENITGLGAGGSASPFSGYMAMRAVGGIGKGAMKLTRGALGGAAAATPILAGAAMGAARFGGQAAAAGAHGVGAGAHLLRTLPNNLLHTSGGGRRGGIAAPYRPPGSAAAAGSGRKVITPSPRTGSSTGGSGSGGSGSGGSGGGDGGGALPPGHNTVRGRTRALETSGVGVTHTPGGRVFTAAATPTPQRRFAPTDYGPRARAAGRMDEIPGRSGPGPGRPDPQRATPVPGARSYRASPRSQPPRLPVGSRPANHAIVAPPTGPAANRPVAAPPDPYQPTRPAGSRMLPNRAAAAPGRGSAATPPAPRPSAAPVADTAPPNPQPSSRPPQPPAPRRRPRDEGSR